MFGRILTFVTLFAAIVLLLFIQSTTPIEAGPGGILTVFFLLFLVITGVCSWLLYLSNVVLIETKKITRSRHITKQPLSMLRSYYYGSVVALGVIMLVAINSVGSLGFYEFGLVILFIGIGIFYLTKRL